MPIAAGPIIGAGRVARAAVGFAGEQVDAAAAVAGLADSAGALPLEAVLTAAFVAGATGTAVLRTGRSHRLHPATGEEAGTDAPANPLRRARRGRVVDQAFASASKRGPSMGTPAADWVRTRTPHAEMSAPT
jgi:hypothetical protein